MTTVQWFLKLKLKAAGVEPRTEPSKATTESTQSPSELRREFVNGTKNDFKNVNEQIFKECFW